MNTYKKRNYRGKRGYSGRPHRRAADSYHQPLPPDLNRIPYARHTLTKPDVEAVVDALLSGTLTQGRELERFESLLSKLTHSDYAISFSTGTAAIHAALACLKLEPEDEVITSTLNFSAVANMVTLIGAKLVLVDCDPQTLTLSVEGVRQAITDNTKVIFTNNFGGHPSDLAELRELCDEYGLVLVEDASHGLGGKYRGHYVGNQADLTCFSFHPSKAITTCEGGAVTTSNRTIAEWLRQFRHHGIQKDSRFFQSEEDKPGWHQELQFIGMNYRLSELHAALGRSQLTRLDRHIERRRSIAQVYYQKLGEIEELILPFDADWADSAFHLFPIQFTGELESRRDDIYQDLKTASIDTQVHYVPVHRMPYYVGKVPGPEAFPNAEAYFSRCLSLPLFPDLSYKEIERITELLIRFINKYRTESQSLVPETTDEQAVSDERLDDAIHHDSEHTGDIHTDDSEVDDFEPLADEAEAIHEPISDDVPEENADVEPEPQPEPSAPEVSEETVPEPEASEPEPEVEPEPEKPKRKTTRRRTTKKAADDGDAKETSKSGRLRKEPKEKSEEGEAEEKPARRKRTTRAKKDDSGDEKPARKTTRRRSTTKSADASDEEKPKTTRRRRTKKAEPEEAESSD